MFIKTYARLLVLLAGGAAAAIVTGAAISPASARPDLRTAFAALDADGDGGISLTEITKPRKALTTDLSTAKPGPDARIAVAAPRGSGDPVYVRYMLDTGASGGVLPLLVMVDLPSGGPQSADVAILAGKAFASLDRNADGKLTADEFERG